MCAFRASERTYMCSSNENWQNDWRRERKSGWRRMTDRLSWCEIDRGEAVLCGANDWMTVVAGYWLTDWLIDHDWLLDWLGLVSAWLTADANGWRDWVVLVQVPSFCKCVAVPSEWGWVRERRLWEREHFYRWCRMLNSVLSFVKLVLIAIPPTPNLLCSRYLTATGYLLMIAVILVLVGYFWKLIIHHYEIQHMYSYSNNYFDNP